MSELRVRNHDEPCEHLADGTVGFSQGAFIVGGVWQCYRVACPGGEEMVFSKVTAEWEGDMAVIRVDPGGEYWIDLERNEL